MLGLQHLQPMRVQSNIRRHSPPRTSGFHLTSHRELDHDCYRQYCNPVWSDFVGAAPRLRAPPTPPAEMGSVVPNFQPTSYYQEQGNYSRDVTKPTTFHAGSHNHSHEAREAGHRQAATFHAGSHSRSTVFPQQTTAVDHQRKTSDMSAIAPALQIPRTINSSQGSLSEMAASITCLFWFESSETLDLAEDPSSAAFALPALEPETVPSTGFRKWVTTILSTTQVAQNVILLALLFIYRLKKGNPTVKGKPGSEYRLLTVALMLGNKFLDDNTYTNKTWAEVSGISVGEVHIMEVEFLSNMKYTLFTSAAQWEGWQTLLGRFAGFVERASRSSAMTPFAGVSIAPNHLQAALPSPPVSTQASPPYATRHSLTPALHPQPTRATNHGLTPRPSPLAYLPELASHNPRKRSLDDQRTEPAAKRTMSYASHAPSSSSHPTASASAPSTTHTQYMPRAALPGYPISSVAQTPLHAHPQHSNHYLPMQLPPLNTATSFASGSWSQVPSMSASMAPASSMAYAAHSSQQLQRQSPYPGSAGVSPNNQAYHPSNQLHTPIQLSPSDFLAHRNSPYRPVRSVSTLLVPPPQRALHQPHTIGNEQMQYQSLGRPYTERQQGHIPCIPTTWSGTPVPKADTQV